MWHLSTCSEGDATEFCLLMRRHVRSPPGRGFTFKSLAFFWISHFLCLCNGFINQQAFQQATSRLGGSCKSTNYFVGKQCSLSSARRNIHRWWDPSQEEHNACAANSGASQNQLKTVLKCTHFQKCPPLYSRANGAESPPATPQEETVEFADELMRSFGNYALSTIHARAIPDTRDGLKPVHRRILYAMQVCLKCLYFI